MTIYRDVLVDGFKAIFDYQITRLAYTRVAFEYGLDFDNCMEHGKEILEQITAEELFMREAGKEGQWIIKN